MRVGCWQGPPRRANSKSRKSSAKSSTSSPTTTSRRIHDDLPDAQRWLIKPRLRRRGGLCADRLVPLPPHDSAEHGAEPTGRRGVAPGSVCRFRECHSRRDPPAQGSGLGRSAVWRLYRERRPNPPETLPGNAAFSLWQSQASCSRPSARPLGAGRRPRLPRGSAFASKSPPTVLTGDPNPRKLVDHAGIEPATS